MENWCGMCETIADVVLVSLLLTLKYPANIYLFKVKIETLKKRCEVCSKLTVTTSERRH